MSEGTAALLSLLDGCANPGVARHAIMVRPAALPADLRRPHHLRLIRAALDPLCSLDRATILSLADDTLIAVWRGPGGAELRAATTTLRQLFADLAAPPVTLLDLPRDSATLRRAIDDATPPTPEPPSPPLRALALTDLPALEAALAQADIAPFLRREPVCTAAPGQPLRLAWEKLTVAARDLAASLLPGVDPRAAPWLLCRLTRSFDRRVLALLADPYELRHAGPFALDLNIATLLDDAFLRFDENLPNHLRGEVILGLLPADIIADPAAFRFAVAFARTRGYRLALRDMTPTLLTVLPPALLGLDLIELRRDAQPPPAALAPQIILCDVTAQATIAWAQQNQIAWLHGPAIRPDRVRLNLHREKARSGALPPNPISWGRPPHEMGSGVP
jgi:hypothetical protein